MFSEELFINSGNFTDVEEVERAGWLQMEQAWSAHDLSRQGAQPTPLFFFFPHRALSV
jgi:hypothetical protein